MGPWLRFCASRMTRSVVEVADLKTGARSHPSSSALLCGRGTNMGSWQKLSIPGDQRCIWGSPVASGERETFKTSCSHNTVVQPWYALQENAIQSMRPGACKALNDDSIPARHRV